MEGGQHMLVERFYRNGVDVRIAEGFEDRLCIASVRFVSGCVRTGNMGREQDDGVAEVLKLPRPVVRRTAGFEDHQRGLPFGEELLEAGTREAMALAADAWMGGDGDLENGLCEIDGYGRMGHGGLLLSERDGTGRPGTV